MVPDEPRERVPRADLEERIRDLEQQLRERNEFLSVVGHELRNPISPLYMQVAVMNDRLTAETGPPDREWLLDQFVGLRTRLDRFLGSLDRLLDISRIGEGTVDLRPDRCDLVEIVRASIQSFAEIERLQLPVTLGGAPEMHGWWDRLRLEQISGNLISNAIRYGLGHPITITVSGDEHRAQLRVEDRGIGIAPHEVPAIFDRFRRVGNPRKVAGFGVGLWVVAELCRAMNGTIEVTSELGKGSTFTVTLPRGEHE